MKFEIESAASFLSNLLRLHSSGLTGAQLEGFRESMTTHLQHHYQQHWFPEKPFKGSGYRCLRINHKMDPIIAKAGVSCGWTESSLRTMFPNELTLWIDPREVSYRFGENGSICVLFDAEANDPKTKGRDQTPMKGTKSTPPQRSSPSESSLSSTTSTLSSPSPSSSPDGDWCRSDRRSSPVSGYQGANGFIPVSMAPSHDPNGLSFGQNCGQLNPGYAFNSNVVNAQRGAGHFNPPYGGGTWSPSRVDNSSPYGGHPFQGQPHPRRPQHNTIPTHHLHHQQTQHHQAYNGWDSFMGFDQSMSRHHHGHLGLNANLEQVAAYVSS